MAQQINLPLQLFHSASFDDIIGQTQLIASLKRVIDAPTGKQLMVVGPGGWGKSHLLQATAQLASEQYQVFYLPLAKHPQFSPEVLDNVQQAKLVIWDDVDAIAGNQPWEEALFAAFNQLYDVGAGLILSSQTPPGLLAMQLADLQSRFTLSEVYQLVPLTDEQKQWLLMQHAQAKGMHMPSEVAQYILRHCSRDVPTLLDFLAQLDQKSLAEKRKLTIPFVKTVL